jgi:hypothetical protein
VEMDQKLRKIEAYQKENEKTLSKEESQKLEIEKN